MAKAVQNRFLFVRRACALAVAVLPFTIAISVGAVLSFNNPQEDRQARERAFSAKADKVVAVVRRAAERDRILEREGKLRPDRSEIDKLAGTVGVKRHIDSHVTVDVAVKLSANGDTELKQAGFAVAARSGDLVTLEVDVDRLPDLAALPSVAKIFGAVKLHPMNDRARQAIGIDSSGQRVVAETGQGIVIGVIDTGIDFRHLDFTVPGSGGQQTRIKAMLDMTVYGAQTPDPGWNYSLPGQAAAIGHLYTEADINAALQTPKPADQNADAIRLRDKSGHGTHVAATAAGNGQASPASGTYSGMAPAADLIIVKASRENDGEDDFRTTDVIDAIEFIKQKASELGEPFVINLSLGGQLGPHDGTLPEERAIDNLVNGGIGRAVCVAAGNEGDSSIHALGTVPAGGSLILDFNVNGEAQFVDLYQGHSDRFTVTVARPDGTTLGPVAYDSNGFTLPNGQASDQYLQIFNANDDKGDADSTNDQPDIFLIFKPGAPNGMWKITLQDADANPNQSFDAWAEGVGVYFSTSMNLSHLISSPGNARGAITVGAFVTRSATQTIGASASFTSPGPTADGRQKPEISAPGYYLYSARSTDALDPNFGTIGAGDNAPTDSVHYTGLAGTSMSTPVTAGAVALLLQTNPNLSLDQIKNRLTRYAVRDIFTGTDDWNARLGFGKLNIANSINQTGGGVGRYSISGRVAYQDGSPVADFQMFMDQVQGTFNAITRTDTNGFYTFTNILGGGNYRVAPPGYNTDFTPSQYVFNSLSANQTANFVRAMPTTITISGRVTNSNGIGIPNVRVEVPGATTGNGLPVLPATTAGDGTYVHTLRPGFNYTVQPIAAQGFSFSPTSRAYPNVTTNQSGADFVAIGPWIYVEEGTNQAAAVNSVTFVHGPFRVTDAMNFSNDHLTRITIFTSNLSLTQPDSTILAVYAGPTSLPVESVGPTNVSGMDASYITVRLLNGMAAGDLPMQVVLRGVNSRNNPILTIAPNSTAWNWFFMSRHSWWKGSS